MRLVLFMILFNSLNAFCIEPNEPFCVDSSYAYQNEYSFDSCRYEVERYLESLDDYMKCVADDSLNKAEEIIKKFNCYASGKTYC